MRDPWDFPLLEFASKAERDLRKLTKRHRPDAVSIRDGLEALRRGATNLDAKQLQGHAPWWRLRFGDWRVLYRKLSAEEVAAVCRRRRPEMEGVEAGPSDGSGFLVARIVNRADLERAVGTLD